MYLVDLCTIPVNLAALPGISVPAGFSQDLPVGLQLIGGHLSERELLQAAFAVEQKLQVEVVAPLTGSTSPGESTTSASKKAPGKAES